MKRDRLCLDRFGQNETGPALPRPILNDSGRLPVSEAPVRRVPDLNDIYVKIRTMPYLFCGIISHNAAEYLHCFSLVGFFLENHPLKIPPSKKDTIVKKISAKRMKTKDGTMILV